MHETGSLLSIASELEFWIDSSTTYVGDDDDRRHSDVDRVAVDDQESAGSLVKRKLPVSGEVNKSHDVYLELSVRESVCKHSRLIQQHRALVLPRSFQHHRIQKWLKRQILEQGFELKKNFQCPPSRCSNDGPLQRVAQSNVDWVSYRYMRIGETGKQVLCRLCHGRNWVAGCRFFRHLFLAHGIMTQIRPNYAANFAVETLRISDYYAVQIQTIRSVEFTRNLAPFLEATLVPLPEKTFSKVLNNGFRRTHVICPHCFRWIRLGWCEYDEIIRQDYEDFDSFRNFNAENYAKMSYVQKRDRDAIEGLYENYFVHYVECDFARFQSRYLYVQVE